jgi:hypothetical protein
MKQNIILLTSTIQPKANQPDLLLIDPQIRLQDYIRALKFYFEQLKKGVIQKVVFVDNSSYDLTELQKQFSHPDLEFISFYGLDYDESYHRGYGEFKLIDYAFSTSRFLNQVDEDSVVWKISGRYIVRNLACVVKAAPKSFDLYVTSRKYWVEMSVMAWSKKGYHSIIKGLYAHFVRSDTPPERVFAEMLRSKMPEGVKILFAFIWPPYLVARKGTDTSYYDGKYDGWWIQFKFLVKSCLSLLIWPYKNYVSNI